MDDTSSNNLTNAIKGLRKFDGRNPSLFRDWHKKLAVVLGVTRRDIANLIKGRARPTEESAATTLDGTQQAQDTLQQSTASFDRANEDLYAILFLLTEKPAANLVLKHEHPDGMSGNGQQALEELVQKYNKVTDEVVRAAMDKLVNTAMTHNQDPDDFFMEKYLARTELARMGEPITDRRFKDICVQGFTSDYKDIKLMMYRDPTFDIEQMQSTMRHLYLDDLSRNSGAKGKIAGRGVAMSAETSICNYCGKEGHHARTCRKKRDEANKSNGTNDKKFFGGKTGTKGAAGQKWYRPQNHFAQRCGTL